MNIRAIGVGALISLQVLGCSRSYSAPQEETEPRNTPTSSNPKSDKAEAVHLQPKSPIEARRRLEMAIVLLSVKSQPKAAKIANEILLTIVDYNKLAPKLRRASKLLVEGRHIDAVMQILTADNRGSMDARQLHAMCWLHGLQLPVQPKTAHMLLKTAGHAGQARAAGQAGRMYELGVGCTKSFGMAEQMYELGVKSGDIDSEAALGALLIRQRSTKRGFMHLKRAAERGSLEAAVGVAKCFALGWGTAPSDRQAELWVRRAAELEVGEAQMGLAILLAKKGNDPKVIRESFAWLKRAAKNQVPMAMALLRNPARQALEKSLRRQRELDEIRAVPIDSTYPFDRDPIAPTLFSGPRTSGYESRPIWTEEGLKRDHLMRSLIDTSQTRGWEERHWFKSHW